jgi:hypothetical protein
MCLGNNNMCLGSKKNYSGIWAGLTKEIMHSSTQKTHMVGHSIIGQGSINKHPFEFEAPLSYTDRSKFWKHLLNRIFLLKTSLMTLQRDNTKAITYRNIVRQ